MSSAEGSKPPDVRSVITSESAGVAPELLRRRLARPWRRGVAITVDCVAISLVSQFSGVLLGLAAAGLALLRLALRSRADAPIATR